MISDMDSRTKNMVHNCYVEILKQMNKNDLQILKAIYQMRNTSSMPIGKLIIVNEDGKSSGYELHNPVYLFNIDNYKIFDYNIDSISIENLLRLGLIEVRYDEYYTDKLIYEKLVNLAIPSCGHILKDVDIESGIKHKLDCKKGIMSINNLGYNLMKICLRDIDN